MSELSSLELTGPVADELLSLGPAPSALARMLAGLTASPSALDADPTLDQHLTDAQLGVASSLFTALRAKHVPSAQHSLRVAVRCSAMAASLELTDLQRSLLEAAALLHDIGNIGIPDQLLLKPSRLTDDEAAVFAQQRRIGVEILSKCCTNDLVLDAVRYCDCWYDGSYPEGVDRAGEDLPLFSRVLSIVNAYDSMTTDRVYRRAMSRERALAELYAGAGTQFDPALVELFSELPPQLDPTLELLLTRRADLRDSSSASRLWKLGQPLFGNSSDPETDSLFLRRLVDNMTDGLIFVNLVGQVTFWNRGIERMTGIPGASIYEKTWTPALLDMRDTEGNLIRDSQCPVLQAINQGTQSLRRVTLRRQSHKQGAVDLQVVPVLDQNGQSHGAAVVVHDVTSELNLEQRVQHLHRKATHDPLTGVANRAEFDRKLTECVEAHLAIRSPCSLIICDIDHFKKINDTFGHQAGDEALISFARLLKCHCRADDVVARYGGEEFVLLSPDCSAASATQRAELLRAQLAQTNHPMLGGRIFTASFGVTELQAGDSPGTMLRRADRALMAAKDAGRNRVVQTGTGLQRGEAPKSDLGAWFGWWKQRWPEPVVNRQLVASVPRDIATEKLRGFIADHSARVVKVDEDQVLLELEAGCGQHERHAADRRYTFIVELELKEDSGSDRPGGHPITRTLIRVSIRPKRNRDRRSSVNAAARNVLVSLCAYLIAAEIVE